MLRGLRHLRRAVRLPASLLVVVVLCVPAGATEADQQQLPVVDPFLCLICHTSDPVESGSFALNAFGTDYLANARQWNAALASLDSDGDGCTNGFELGDADGDGQGDGNVEELRSNPGSANDCGGANVDSRTWGDLKALFDRN